MNRSWRNARVGNLPRLHKLILFNPTSRAHAERAFTRAELMAVAGALGLLGIMALPLMGRSGDRTEQAVCQNNLRWIGQAFNLWGEDHGGQRPFLVLVSNGGTRVAPKVGHVWYEMAWISNELVTPKVLACPADTETTRVARDFSARADGGLLHANYRANAVSYFLGLNTFPNVQDAPLSGDRNFIVDFVNAGNASGMDNASYVANSINGGRVAWTNGIHHFQGNLLFNDGRVAMLNQRGIRDAFNNDYAPSQFVLMPR